MLGYNYNAIQSLNQLGAPCFISLGNKVMRSCNSDDYPEKATRQRRLWLQAVHRAVRKEYSKSVVFLRFSNDYGKA